MESKSKGESARRVSDPAPARRSSKAADRDPKSKLRDAGLEDPLEGGAIGADLPWGLRPNSEVKRPSKSFMVVGIGERGRSSDLVRAGAAEGCDAGSTEGNEGHAFDSSLPL